MCRRSRSARWIAAFAILLTTGIAAAAPLGTCRETTAAQVPAAAPNEAMEGSGSGSYAMPSNLTGNFALRPPHNVWIPVAEVAVLHAAIFGFDHYVAQAGYAQVDSRTILRNFGGGWRLDPDNIWVNFLGHPYHGGLYFNAARSNSLTFWESAPFAIVGGVLWELTGENQAPSPNDAVNTAYGGILFGEMFHRLAGLLIDSPQPPTVVDRVGAFLLDPLGSVNRQMLGAPTPRVDLPALPPTEVSARLGGWALAPNTQIQSFAGSFGVDVLYGQPGERVARTWGPFDYFEVRAAASAPGPATLNGSLRAMIAGFGWGRHRGSGGAWGVMGTFDFLSGPTFRLASTGLGPGLVAQHEFAPGWRLRATGMAGVVPMGGAGHIYETDVVRPPEETEMLYFLGPGAQALYDTELLIADRGTLRLWGQGWLLGLQRDGSRWERAADLSAEGRVLLFGRHSAGLGVDWLNRAASARGGQRDENVILRAFWEYSLSPQR